MEIYDVIESLNKAVKDQGHYVLHRNMQEQSIKIYKKFTYDLYFVKGKDKELVLTHCNTLQVPSNDIIKIWQKEDIQFLIKLLTWFKYGNYTDE